MTANRPIATQLLLVLAVQLILGLAMSRVEGTSLESLSKIGFFLCFFGAPVAYFMVLRKADVFRASSRGTQLASAAIAAILLGSIGLVVVLAVSLVFFGR